jgi:hypothetical protein
MAADLPGFHLRDVNIAIDASTIAIAMITTHARFLI